MPSKFDRIAASLTVCPSAGMHACHVSVAAGSAATGADLFFSSRRRHTRLQGDWSSDVCSSDLARRLRKKNPVPLLAARDRGAWDSYDLLSDSRPADLDVPVDPQHLDEDVVAALEIGRASCRERV